MALITDKNIKIFDVMAINKNDCIRIRRTGDTVFKNGFVTKVSENSLEILYGNTQNNATSYLNISAADVAIGVWEVWWTSDFRIVNYENNAGGDSNA